MQILKSTRFQALLILALVGVLQDYGWIASPIAQAFYLVLATHIGVRTIDKFSQKMGK